MERCPLRFPWMRYASFFRLAVLPAALTLAVGLPIHAQNTLKTLSYNIGQDTWEGVMQASDGNFYTNVAVHRHGLATPLRLPGRTLQNTCTYITKITPDGTATIFHTFELIERPEQHRRHVAQSHHRGQ